MKKTCPQCEGKGEVSTQPFWIKAMVPCLKCKGTGFYPVPKPTKAELKRELMVVINGMTDLEVRMARESFQTGASIERVASWVNESSRMSSKLDKLYKSL